MKKIRITLLLAQIRQNSLLSLHICARWRFNLFGLGIMKPASNANLVWNFSQNTSLEVYIPAPASIKLAHVFGGSAGSYNFNLRGNLTGHLISE
jgi:hypothetical protein